MTTRRDILGRISARLAPLYGAREARSIALVAVSELSGLSASALLTDPGAPLEIAELDDILGQLAAGRPVQYVVGRTEFCGRTFAVREGVLIPRPETEELAAWIAQAETEAAALLDVGTGSGCIAATLALALPGAQVYAADISDAALAQADRQDMAGRLRQQLERKMRTTRHTTQYELKTKLIRYGLSLGYDYETVLDSAAALVTDTETCDEF